MRRGRKLALTLPKLLSRKLRWWLIQRAHRWQWRIWMDSLWFVVVKWGCWKWVYIGMRRSHVHCDINLSSSRTQTCCVLTSNLSGLRWMDCASMYYITTITVWAYGEYLLKRYRRKSHGESLTTRLFFAATRTNENKRKSSVTIVLTSASLKMKRFGAAQWCAASRGRSFCALRIILARGVRNQLPTIRYTKVAVSRRRAPYNQVLVVNIALY